MNDFTSFEWIESIGHLEKIKCDDTPKIFKPSRSRLKVNWCVRCSCSILSHTAMWIEIYQGKMRMCTSCMHTLKYLGYKKYVEDVKKYREEELNYKNRE